MSPLSMDTGFESSSPCSLSAEESRSNTAGSEREGGEQRGENRATKRQEKNRDAARKSRRKQTERADELHEELQSLERSNSALQKEVAALKKDLHLYTTALERHKPFCRLKAPVSSSTTCLSVFPSADGQIAVPPQASSTTQAAVPSLSTSLTSSPGLQTLDCVDSTHLSSSAPATTLASSAGSSAQPLTSSSSLADPYSVSFSTVLASHSLFSKDPPSLITSRPTSSPPVCTSLFSNLSGSLTAAAQPQSRVGITHESPSASADCLSTPHTHALMKQGSFQTASPDVEPHYSRLVAENAGLAAQGCPMNAPQLHSDHFSVSPVHSSLPYSLLPPTPGPGLQSLLASPQANLEPSPASVFASKPSHSFHITPSPMSLLSLLTVPGPLNVPQTTSSSSDEPLSQPPPSLPLLGDPYFSELLEVNDWILQ
ncbi:basic leucine zipper transcriptional factor ATF-like 2 [Pempheris klunzingeri]|uniref:basic leucine zipper transcriptional factor ATF-like 2 n=1 Tax=Pempheris klunzingeri TaxID=3127111 RepID=UPI00397EF2AE